MIYTLFAEYSPLEHGYGSSRLLLGVDYSEQRLPKNAQL
ncbi:hypothetical protein Ple7327_3916 [Pleurocapsa sp. PCC 7327]|nr:hypothetical protein Ple7327_3916 [Pleurocapsa sp. PCC 7327]